MQGFVFSFSNTSYCIIVMEKTEEKALERANNYSFSRNFGTPKMEQILGNMAENIYAIPIPK